MKLIQAIAVALQHAPYLQRGYIMNPILQMRQQRLSTTTTYCSGKNTFHYRTQRAEPQLHCYLCDPEEVSSFLRPQIQL